MTSSGIGSATVYFQLVVAGIINRPIHVIAYRGYVCSKVARDRVGDIKCRSVLKLDAETKLKDVLVYLESFQLVFIYESSCCEYCINYVHCNSLSNGIKGKRNLQHGFEMATRLLQRRSRAEKMLRTRDSKRTEESITECIPLQGR